MAVGEWDQRQLCADGGCIGVIGPEGTCKVCGRAAPNWGDERTRGLVQPPEDEGEADDDELAADADEDADAEDADAEHEDDDGGEGDGPDADEAGGERGDVPMGAAPTAAPPREWTERQLCPDGACIGLIGPDGRCRECGRSAAPDAGARSAAGAETAGKADRERCADASCTGAIGADGRCEVCGKGAS